MTLQTSSVAESYVPPRAWSAIAQRVLIYVLLIAVSLLFLVPFVWTIATSFKTIPDSVNVNLIPHPWTTSAWHDIWTNYDFKLYIRNSLFLAVLITATNMLLAGLGGYPFARPRL